MTEKIIVKINPVGQATIEAEGFVGRSCFEKTKPIEDVLAGKAGDVITEEKPEANMIDFDQTQNNYMEL
jgi:hypothetical protein